MKTEQTIEEYYLDKIKECLSFNQDQMATRFLEKYHQAKADKNNNHISNLEWCNGSENILHAYKMNLIPLKKNKK